MAHTPGPWWIEEPDDPTEDDRHISDSLGNTATVYGDPETAMANARLIAASPELLAALRSIMELYFQGQLVIEGQPEHEDDPVVGAAMHAIAKAEGRSTDNAVS